MVTVLFAKCIPNKKGVQLGVLVDDEKCTFTVSEATYVALKSPGVGFEMSESDLGTVRFEDEYRRAFSKALGYLSLSDKSRFELKMKLLRAGFSGEASEMAISRILELGYLDEDRQLERAVEKEANYGLRGRYYIKRKLSSKGYSVYAISSAIDRLTERGEIDFSANFERLAQKKGAVTFEDRRALEYKFGYKI